MSELETTKSALRDRMREARREIGSTEREGAAHALAERMLDTPEVASARVVLGYAATSEEIDLGPALDALRATGARIVYPRIAGPGELTLHEVASDAELVPGPLGIRQPSEDAAQVAPAEIDLALVPGLAFDSSGHRLGHGGGYYDRLLPQLGSGCLRVGIGFDVQVADEVPTGDHDEVVDAVLTPERLLWPW